MQAPLGAGDVVGDDQPARAGVIGAPAKLVGRVDLVGAAEDEVEETLLPQSWERLQSGSDPHLDPILHSRPLEAPARHLRVLGLRLQRDQPPAGGQGPRHQDRAVTAEGAELEDPLRAEESRQKLEQLSLGRGHLDGGQAGGLRCGHSLGERRVLAEERRLDELVDR